MQCLIIESKMSDKPKYTRRSFYVVKNVAAIYGMFQSLVWIGMSLTGIFAYNCFMEFSQVTKSTITEFTIYDVYFRGNCKEKNVPLLGTIAHGHTVMSPKQINIWMYVYLAISIIWFISSATLLKKSVKKYILYIWSAIVMVMLGIDLGLGIVFGIDLNKFTNLIDSKSLDKNNQIPLNDVIIMTAKNASIVMMLVVLRGFILYIINYILLVYFLSLTQAKPSSKTTSFDNQGFVADSHSILTRAPISAYSSNTHPVRLKSDPIKKANAISLHSLQQRWSHNKGETSRNTRLDDNPVGYSDFIFKSGHYSEPYVPPPDYSPMTTRSNPFDGYPPKSALRNKKI